MATKYGKTWWGEQWLGALKNIDYSNRLPRGASYARNGMVQEINFSGNIISAKVKGSRRTPYSETIKLPEFSSKDIDKLIKLILEQPVVLSKLFNRQLDESLAKMAEEAGQPLNAGKIAELSGLDRKEVDTAMKQLKAEGAIVSPVRCKWAPAE